MSKRSGQIVKDGGAEAAAPPQPKRRKVDSSSHIAQLTHDKYSVGWICVLPKEQTAAAAMLDQRHADLLKLLNDPNTYTLGSIRNHNVVIACLPKGKIGTIPAATVATWMVSTFPSIKFGLMVGIGGGVPPKVRLGDVVVSTSVGLFPGVVQWDFGKAKQGNSFERTKDLGSYLTSKGPMCPPIFNSDMPCFGGNRHVCRCLPWDITIVARRRLFRSWHSTRCTDSYCLGL